MAAGIWGLSDTPKTLAAWRELLANPDPEVHTIGLAGLIRSGDRAALAEAVRESDQLPARQARGYILLSIEGLETATPDTFKHLGHSPPPRIR